MRIVHLDRERAGDAWDMASPWGPLVASCTATVLESTSGDGSPESRPPSPATAVVAARGGRASREPQPSDRTRLHLELRRPDFSLWLLTPVEPSIPGVAGQFDADFGVFEGLGTVADWPEKTIVWHKRREGHRLVWEADVTPALLEGVRDVVIEARYQGACGRATLNGHLISDHYFGCFLVWEIGLRDWLSKPGVLRLEFDDCSGADAAIVSVVERELTIMYNNGSAVYRPADALRVRLPGTNRPAFLPAV